MSLIVDVQVLCEDENAFGTILCDEVTSSDDAVAVSSYEELISGDDELLSCDDKLVSFHDEADSCHALSVIDEVVSNESASFLRVPYNFDNLWGDISVVSFSNAVIIETGIARNPKFVSADTGCESCFGDNGLCLKYSES